MNDKTQSNIHFFRQFAFMLVIYTMVIQPATQTFAFLVQGDYELVIHQWDKDDDDEKKQEKEGKDEKIEMRIASDYSYHFIHNKKSLCPWTRTSIWDIHLEIPIPRPELT